MPAKEKDFDIDDYIIDRGVIDTTYKDIGGLEKQKQIMQRVISFSKRLIKSKLAFPYTGKLLLYGPPGTGKTLMSYATSGESGWMLYELRLSTVISEFLGNTQKNMAMIFDKIKALGREKFEKHQEGIIFFMDEFDYLVKNRSNTKEIGEMKRLVNVILKEFDELSFSGDHVITICATNHQTMLDPAVWRRFNTILNIDFPDEKEREDIINLYLDRFSNYNIELKEKSELIDTLIKKTEKKSGAEIRRDIEEVAISLISENISSVDSEMFINFLDNNKSESLYEIFTKNAQVDEELYFRESRSPTIFHSELNPYAYEEILLKELVSEDNYKLYLDLAAKIMEFPNQFRESLKSLDFFFLHTNDPITYIKQLKKRSEVL